MCGIAGHLGPEPIPARRIDACLASMARRGPDHAGTYTRALDGGAHLTMLHTRLSIIDPEPASHQPFRLGHHVLVYNGEVYNFVELRAELERLGFAPRSRGDTEVLIAALRLWGHDALDRLEGMWAFALFDEAQERLLLCRDRFGEKPLYLLRDETGLYFGSEPKFLFALRGRTSKVNDDQLCRYLVNGYKAIGKSDATFFEDVRRVAPATFVEIDAAGRVSEARYWAPSIAPDSGMAYADAVAGVREHLRRTVELRLRADAPLAFCLSGGVDSNALAATARRTLDRPVHAFTLVNQDRRYDEQEQVRLSVRELGIQHTAVPIDPSRFRERITELVRYHDAPLLTVTSYVQWLLLAEMARQGFRVSVSGVGADELLTGYYDHHNFYLAELGNSQDRASALDGWKRNVAPYVRNPHLQDPLCFVRDPELRDHVYLDAPKFAGFLAGSWSEAFEERRYAPTLLRNRMLNEIHHETVPAIVNEDDLNAMYHSIESRAPFLSRELFEFCQRIPTRHLIRGGLAKAPLRDAMAGVAPSSVLTNPRKVGFNAPITALLDLDDPGTRSWLMQDGPVFRLIERHALADLLDRRAFANSESKFLFYYVCTKVFLEAFETT